MGITTSKIERDLINRNLPPGEKFFGLENFGNTCYVNSVLQALYFCLPFREAVITYYINFMNQNNKTLQNQQNYSPQQQSQLNNSNNGTNSSGMSGYVSSYWGSSSKSISQKDDSLVLSLGELFHSITQQKKQSGALAPKRFIDRVRFENELFRSYMHQDAHEFLNFLLNSITEYLQKEIKEREDKQQENNKKDGVDEEPKRKKEDIKTFIHNIFEGTLTNETKCLTCESITNKDESFLDLSIDIEQNQSIVACMGNFSSVEVLSKNDKFFCDKCNSLQEAQKRMKIKKVPSTLIIHLKRFKFIESLQQYKKLNSRVYFPLEYIPENTTNDIPNPDGKLYLFAVTIHVGSGPNQGHYISLIKSNGTWFRFDDDNIQIIPEDDIQKCFGHNTFDSNECGYLLFYQSFNT